MNPEHYNALHNLYKEINALSESNPNDENYKRWSETLRIIPEEYMTPTYVSDAGKEYFFEKTAIADLLEADVLFAYPRRDVSNDKSYIGEPHICLCVGASDVFFWACSQSVPIEYNEIENLYRMYLKDGWWGQVKWCCLKEGMRPQWPVERDMRAAGKWDDDLEALPVRDKKDGDLL